MFRSALTRYRCRLLQRFTGQINIVDSSVVALPEGLQAEYRGCGGGSGPKASLKLQLVFDFLRGNVEQLGGAGRTGGGSGLPGLPGGGHAEVADGLADLGYFCLEAFAAIGRRAVVTS